MVSMDTCNKPLQLRRSWARRMKTRLSMQKVHTRLRDLTLLFKDGYTSSCLTTNCWYWNRFHGDGIYEGEFRSNVPMGQARYTWLDGTSYEGEVKAGLRHGTGTQRPADGSVEYTGQLDNGARTGHGVYYSRRGTLRYEEEWLDNSREGYGVIRYPSGSMYKGEWQNNAPHGQGTMKWVPMGQVYVGTWHNGVQHGQGTHTWFLRHPSSPHLSQSNVYRGEFVLGLRHGQGTFYYANGTIYEGQWRRGQKHGQAKVTFSDGSVYEGEFKEDNMGECPPCSADGHSILGCDIALSISSLLETLPEGRRWEESKQVECAVLRYITELRDIFTFYRSLGDAPDHGLKMSALQFCCLLHDCTMHRHGVSRAQLQGFLADSIAEDMVSPFSGLLLGQMISALVVVSFYLYHQHIQSPSNILEACFCAFMAENVLPRAKTVKGILYRSPQHALVAGGYVAWCLSLYQNLVSARNGHMTRRHLLWLLKRPPFLPPLPPRRCTYAIGPPAWPDHGVQLTTREVLKVMAAEDCDQEDQGITYMDLEVEVSFLDFLWVLLSCVKAKTAPAMEVCTSC